MSLLSGLFGSKEPAPRPGVMTLDDRLAKLEQEAENAPAGYKGTPLNKAGDFALRDGDKPRAFDYYGRAIDALLEDDQREAARGVAKQAHPSSSGGGTDALYAVVVGSRRASHGDRAH